MKYDSATIDAAHVDTNEATTIDLENVRTTGDLIAALVEAFPPADDTEREADSEEPDEIPARVRLFNPQGFAVHLFQDDTQARTSNHVDPVTDFDDLLAAWNDEGDEDRREAMGEYLDDMGAADLSDFDEAYNGQWDSGAAFAENTADELGEVPKSFPSWIVIDWEASWNANLRHDYHMTDSGHVFRRM